MPESPIDVEARGSVATPLLDPAACRSEDGTLGGVPIRVPAGHRSRGAGPLLLRAGPPPKAVDSCSCISILWHFARCIPLQVHGLLALIPLLDLITDVSILVNLLVLGQFIWMATMAVLLLLAWRFLILFAALTPSPNMYSFTGMFLPFTLHPCWTFIIGAESRKETIRALYNETLGFERERDENRSQPSGGVSAKVTGSSTPNPRRGEGPLLHMLYGRECSRVRAFILQQHEVYMRQHCLIAPLFMIFFEVKLFLLTLTFGPLLIWRSAVRTSLELFILTTEEWTVEKEAAELVLHQRMLSIIEAIYQGAPQLTLQTFINYRVGISINPIAFQSSVACSSASILCSLMYVAAHRDGVLRTLRPTRHTLARRARALSESSTVDCASLAASIVAARAAGAMADELHAAVKRLWELKVVQARGLRELGWSAADLKSQGFLGIELKEGGYLPAEIKDAGYSAAEMRTEVSTTTQDAQGWKNTRLAPGVDKPAVKIDARRRDLGICSTRSGETGSSATGASGYFSERGIELLSNREETGVLGGLFSSRPTQPFPNALMTETALAVREHTPAQLMVAGYTLEQLHANGMPAAVLQADGYSAAELTVAGYTLAELALADYPLQQLKQMGHSAEELSAAGYSASHLRAVGFQLHDLIKVGFSVKQLKQAGFPLKQLKMVFSFQQLVDAGFSASDFKNAGVSPLDKDMNRALDKQVKDYSVIEMKQAGRTVKQLKAAGYTPVQLKEAFPLSQLASHFLVIELKDAGFVLEDLVASGLSAKKLRDAGFTAAQMRTEGFAAGEMKAAGFAVKDMQAAGYTTEELKVAGMYV
jgi:ribosomal protein L13E